MERKVTHLYQMILVILFLIGFYAIFKIQNNVYSYNSDNVVEDWSNRMDVEKTDSTLLYSIKLPAVHNSNKIIAFSTFHAIAEVRINDTLIYSLMPSDNSFTKTTGYNWSFVLLQEEYAGQKLTIQLKSVYDRKLTRPTIYYGRHNAVTRTIATKDLFNFLVSVFIFIFGMILFFYSYIVVGRNDSSLKHFSIFTILLGIWQFSDSSLCMLLIPWSAMLAFAAHGSLMLMPIPFLLFLRTTYQERENPLWYIYCLFNCAVCVIRITLQLTSVYDLRETLWLTHISIVLFVMVALYLSIRELIINRMTKQMRINIGCIFIIMGTTLADLISYNITGQNSAYGCMGFLLYVLIMGSYIVKRSRQLLLHAHENEVYRKLAFTDELTGLFNRTAFRQDMDSRIQTNSQSGRMTISPTVILMFDLNDLKKCNDTFGHEYGDQYIMISSQIIEQVFGVFGRCYRIGGDEFCVILPFTSQNEVENCLEQFRRRLRERNRKPFVVPINVAAGYAIYDSSIDSTLDDTQNRADELMYQNKQQLKNKDHTHNQLET